MIQPANQYLQYRREKEMNCKAYNYEHTGVMTARLSVYLWTASGLRPRLAILEVGMAEVEGCGLHPCSFPGALPVWLGPLFLE